MAIERKTMDIFITVPTSKALNEIDHNMITVEMFNDVPYKTPVY